MIVLGSDRIVEYRRVPRAPAPPPLYAHKATPATAYGARPKADPQTRTDTHNRVRTDRVDQAGSLSLRGARAPTSHRRRPNLMGIDQRVDGVWVSVQAG